MYSSDADRNRYYEPGHVYIAGSLSGRILKIGKTSKSISYYERYLRNKRHGNLKDWVILCYAWVSASGPIETATLRKLRVYKTTREYFNGKDAQSSKETVKCAFSKARRALSSCLSADEKLRPRKSSLHDEFEFGLIASKQKAKLALLKNPLLSEKGKSNLQVKTNDLELNIRTANCLKNSNLSCVGDLTLMTESEMLGIPNFGYTSLNELRQLLAAMGLRFKDEPNRS